MSKEQALAEYLKKSAEPTYCSKVLGGGIIFKKAQSKDSWKKRTYYIKDDKKLLYFYYGGKAKPPLGMLDVTSSLLSIGPADNVKKSGALKAEAVSIAISLANESSDNNSKHLVFETVSEAKKFALMIAYASRNSNVVVFAQMMDWSDLEEACGVVNGTSVRKFIDVDKCAKEAQLQGELVKYQDEIDDYEHKQRLYTSIKAQNTSTKTTAESFEVLQANLLLSLVEQRLEYLKKRQQEMNEKLLQVRSFTAGMEIAKQQTAPSPPQPPPPKRKQPVTTENSNGSPISTESVEQRQESVGSEDGVGDSGSKTLRMKSFRRLMSMSRNKSIGRSASISSDDTPTTSPVPVINKASSIPPPPPKSKEITSQSTPNSYQQTNGNISSHGDETDKHNPPSFQEFTSPASSRATKVDATPKPESLQNSAQFTPYTQGGAGTPFTTGMHNGEIMHTPHAAVEQWREPLNDGTHAFCADCLRTMKSFIPFDMASCDYTEDILVRKNGLTMKLAERIMKKKILWIIHLTIREIERIADRDFMVGGKYSIKGHNLDLVELAAVYAVLPGFFPRSVDPEGVKETWRREVEDRLVGYLREEGEETLTSDELRHEAYTTNMGDKWQERASLDAKLNHMMSLFHVIKFEVAQAEHNESTEQSFEKLAKLQERLTALMEHKRFKKILANKKITAKMKKKNSSRHEIV